MDFGRVLTAMITPFKEDGSVNYEEAQKIANYLVDNGTDGIVVAGTTGESPTLSDDEKIQLFKVIKEAVGGRAIVIAGTGSNSTSDSITLTKEAEKTGVQGIMLVTPYYNKPQQAALYEHFKTIALSTQLPIMLYNVPGRTVADLLPATVAKLAKIENIVAIKEASGKLDYISEIRLATSDDFTIYSGDDSLTLPMLTLGSRGIVSVASHLVGNKMKEMILAFEAGQIKEAGQIHLEIYPLIKALFIISNPVPVKAAMKLKGFKVGSMRLPLMDAEVNEIKLIEKAMVDAGVL